MTQLQTNFDDLLVTARDLNITVVTGQLGPPLDGDMWIGNQSLSAILCPNQSERQVAILIAPGGPGRNHIRIGRGTLAASDLTRLAQNATASGGSVHQGLLAVLTPVTWLNRHDDTQPVKETAATFAAAKVAGWPAHCGNDSVLFLDDRSIFSLLAAGNIGRTVTLLVGTIAEPGHVAAKSA